MRSFVSLWGLMGPDRSLLVFMDSNESLGVLKVLKRLYGSLRTHKERISTHEET